MKKEFRAGRLGEEIKKVVSGMLISELKDPKLSDAIITVSAVDVTTDGSFATIFVTVLPMGGNFSDKKNKGESVLAALNHAKGTIRSRLARDIKLRYTPELIFKIDESQEYGNKMDDLIDKAVKGD